MGTIFCKGGNEIWMNGLWRASKALTGLHSVSACHFEYFSTIRLQLVKQYQLYFHSTNVNEQFSSVILWLVCVDMECTWLLISIPLCHTQPNVPFPFQISLALHRQNCPIAWNIRQEEPKNLWPENCHRKWRISTHTVKIPYQANLWQFFPKVN